MNSILTLSIPAALFLFTSCQSTPEQTTGPDRFALADGDGNGELTAAELSRYAACSIFSDRDTNHDGRITRVEWNPAISPQENREFALRDANNDGAVTLTEAGDYAQKKQRFADDVKAADTNKNGTVNRAEAQAYYASKEGPMH